MRIEALIDKLKNRIVNTVTALFSHGPQPLARTLSYDGDPGLLGPDSVSWEIIGDVTALVGGVRALVLQTAHPEVVAGVDDHSRYRSDPLGRLSRTSLYVTETTYGAMPEVDAAISAVRNAHIPVKGISGRAKPYSADDPEMAAWVHNVLTNSFLIAFQTYGPRSLTNIEANKFVTEQSRIGGLLGAKPLPASEVELSRWIVEHPDLAATEAQARAVEFLLDPPLPLPVKIGYRLVLGAAIATLPAEIAHLLNINPRKRGIANGRRVVNALRWALGSSPSWHLALVRAGAPVPPFRFSQPLPSSDKRSQNLIK